LNQFNWLKGNKMARCETCGNEYDKAFTVTIQGKSHVFDSFECAISALAPNCETCGVRIIGHGLEVNGAMYCCAHCAGKDGEDKLRDRA
jgi:ribosome-binding protein aMBF1 (putative translation factor)